MNSGANLGKAIGTYLSEKSKGFQQEIRNKKRNLELDNKRKIKFDVLPENECILRNFQEITENEVNSQHFT